MANAFAGYGFAASVKRDGNVYIRAVGYRTGEAFGPETHIGRVVSMTKGRWHAYPKQGPANEHVYSTRRNAVLALEHQHRLGPKVY